MFRLSKLFEANKVYRDATFDVTFFPHGNISKNCIAYIINDAGFTRVSSNDNVSSVITTNDYKNKIDASKGVVVSDDPFKEFYNLHNRLVSEYGLSVKHENQIPPSADIDKAAYIGKNVFIGENVRLGVGVVIHDNSYIEDNVIIEDYCVIGSHGMQDMYNDEVYFFAECAGGVHIEKDSHLSSNTIVARPYQPFYTKTGKRLRTGISVTIGHGVTLGDDVAISSNSSIGGNTKIGNSVWVGMGCIVSSDITIGNNASIKVGSVVISNVMDGESISGNFAYDHLRNMRNFASHKRK